MRIEEALKQIPDTQQLRIAEIVENIAVIIKEEKISSSGSQWPPLQYYNRFVEFIKFAFKYNFSRY